MYPADSMLYIYILVLHWPHVSTPSQHQTASKDLCWSLEHNQTVRQSDNGRMCLAVQNIYQGEREREREVSGGQLLLIGQEKSYLHGSLGGN